MRIELLLFLSMLAMIVVIFACGVPRRQTLIPAPTLFPDLTLTMYDSQVEGRVSGEAALSATILTGSSQFREIDISPPRCYDTISPRITCLGYLRNLTQSVVSDLRLRARFRGPDGNLQGETRFSPEQRRIEAADMVPYRLEVPASRLETAVLELEVVEASVAPVQSIELSLREEAGDYQPTENSYRFTGRLVNEGAEAARDIRLLVTLEDGEGAIVGYRAVDIEQELPSGGTMPVDISLTPLTQAGSVRHRVSVQGAPLTQR